MYVPLFNKKHEKMAGSTNDFGSQAGNLMSQVGGSALGSLVGTGMGLLFNETNDMNQNQEQKDLDAIQQQYQQSMSAFNYGQQLNLWKETNYPAQVQELEQAGLNPALLYGSHGAGATATTGTPQGNIQGANAIPNAPNQMAIASMQQMGMQADINLKNAEADRIKAVTPPDIKQTQATTANLLAGVNNQQAQTALTQAQTDYQKMVNDITNKTIDDQVAGIRAQNANIENTLQMQVRANQMSQQTYNDTVATIHGNMLGTLLNNALLKSQTQLTQQQRDQIVQQLAQGWKQIEINQGNLAVSKMNANTADAQQQTNDALRQLQQQMFNYHLDQTPIDQFMQGAQRLVPTFGMYGGQIKEEQITPKFEPLQSKNPLGLPK